MPHKQRHLDERHLDERHLDERHLDERHLGARPPLDALRSVVDELADGVLVVGATGELVYANPGAWRLLGFGPLTPARPPVRNLRDLEPLASLRVHDGRRVSLAAWLGAQTVAEEPSGEQEITLLGADGGARPVACAAGPALMDQGKRGAWLRIRDISGEAAMATKLREEQDATATRARDLARARVTSARLRSLVQVAGEITSADQPEALFRLITAEAVRLLGADAAYLFTVDDRGAAVVGRAAYGADPQSVVGLRLELRAHRGIAEVLRSGRTAAHGWIGRSHGPLPEFLRVKGVRSYASVPLVESGRSHGVLFVTHVRAAHAFGNAELTFLETITGYVSVALARLLLLSDLREAVTSLQVALLPSSFPQVPGVEIAARYRSASEVAQVGGDFYDVVPLEDGRLAAAVGDVCGKGVTAARHTARLRLDLRAALERGGSPGEVLAEFNRRVGESLGEDSFATMALLVLDPVDGICQWASAGHPPPLATHPGPRLLRFGGSLAVGLEPDATYRTGTMQLPVGAGLVLYTDGVLEARAPDGRQLGAAGLRVTVRRLLRADAETVAEGILEAVTRHSEGALTDDVAVLVLRRPPQAA